MPIFEFMNVVLDFDSTLIQVESLDILAAVCNRSETIQEEIKRQGDVVRKLKSSGAAKDEVCWYFL